MAKNDAEIRLTAVDATKAAFTSVKNSLTGLKSSLGQIHPALAGAFSVAAVLAFTKSMFNAAEEAERSGNRLRATLKATGLAAGITGTEINKMADDLAETTIFDDEKIRDAAAALLRFRDIQGDTFREALRLAPDLASALGDDLVSAAEKLGKALVNPATGMRALRVAGVNLSESQADLAEKLIKTGDSAGAAKIVLDQLRGSVGGLAAGENTGLTGASTQLKKAWNELLETLGEKSFQQGGFLSDVTKQLKDTKAEIEAADSALVVFINRFLRSPPIRISPLGGPAAGLADFLEGQNKPDNRRLAVGKISGLPTEEEKAAAGAEAQRKSRESEAAANKAAEARKSAESAAKRAAEAIKSFTEALKKERDTLGMNTAQIKVYEAAKLGIKGATLDNVRSMAQEIQAFSDEAEALKHRNLLADEAFKIDQEEVDARHQSIKTIREYIEEYELQTSLIGSTNEKREISIGLLELERAGIEKASDTYEDYALKIEHFAKRRTAKSLLADTRTEMDDLTVKIQSARKSFDEGFLDFDELSKIEFGLEDKIRGIGQAATETKEPFEDLKRTIEGFGRQTSKVFVDLLFTGKGSFRELIQSMLREMAELAVYQSIFGPIFGMLSGAISGGYATNAFAGMIPHGATGGRFSGGGPIMVGERGPEMLFMPNGASGYIQPNGATGGAVNNNITVNVSGGGSGRGAGSASELGRIVASAVGQEIGRLQRPGGSLQGAGRG